MIVFRSPPCFRSVACLSALAAAGLLLGAAPAALAQTVSGGTSGGLGGPDVSASSSGSGQQTTSPDGTSIGVSGDANATAVDGTAKTSADAKLNERRAMQRSMATAKDDDERARSRTRTMVRDGQVRSRTMSIYHQKGEKAEHEMNYSVSTPEGTTTRTK